MTLLILSSSPGFCQDAPRTGAKIAQTHTALPDRQPYSSGFEILGADERLNSARAPAEPAHPVVVDTHWYQTSEGWVTFFGALQTLILGGLLLVFYRLMAFLNDTVIEMKLSTKANFQALEIARASGDAAKAIADSFIASERAYIYPGHLHMHKADTIPEISYNLVNTGKTPAIIEEVRVDILAAAKLPAKPVFKKSSPILTSQQPLAQGESFQPPRPCVYPRELSAEEMQKLKDGSFHLFFYGYVKYRDVFGALHERGFAMKAAAASFSTNGGATYNYDIARDDSDTDIT